ncbi:MAG TPA: cell wall-active antibiotics response protein [Firmicutes bacterium]|nr:cell wall-active antibiotics response protein [Bacillota bacterium]
MNLFKGRVLLSIFLVLLGAVLLLNNLGITEINFRQYWPLFPLLWGLGLAVNAKQEGSFFSFGQFVSGLVVMAISTAYLLRNLDVWDPDFSLFWKLFWPVLLILAGVSILRGKMLSSDTKTNWAVMGGVERGKTAWTLKDESFVALMGGINLDLTRAEIPEGETVLDCMAIMGGIDIIVPPGPALICEGTALLGGVDFLREGIGGIIAGKHFESGLVENPDRIVRIQARAILGGIEVKRAG